MQVTKKGLSARVIAIKELKERKSGTIMDT